MRITIVIPTYNEAENLPKMVSALCALPLDHLSILVVDDNSPDGSGKIADKLSGEHPGKLSVIHRAGKLGLGTAYVAGFRQAIHDGAEAIGQMDADFSHPVAKIPELMTVLDTHDIALGSRYVSGGSVDKHWPFWRKALSAFGNVYARAILRLPIHDVTGGFKIWRRESLLGMPLDNIKSNGYAFQIEMNYLAYKLGWNFKEIPIYFADRRWGKSKMSFDIQREAAFQVWRIFFEYRHLDYKL